MRFLFVDRIVELTPGESVRGVKHITQDDAYLVPNEQGQLCFVSSLIGETLGQLAAWNVMEHNGFTARPVAGVVASATLHRSALLGETLLLESFIERLDDQAVQYHSVAKVGDELVFTVEGALGPLLPMQNFISQEVVAQQFAEIYRPGDWAAFVNASTAMTSPSLLQAEPSRAALMCFDRAEFDLDEQTIIAEKRISRAAPFFADHFPNKPVLPMTVLLECKLNLAYEFLKQKQWLSRYRVYGLRKIKMNEFVQPGDVVTCYVKVKSQTEEELVLSYRSEVDGKRICVADVVLVPKG